MTAPADWLTGGRPPLPFREKTPLYDQAVTAAGVLLADREARESTAVLYRVEELTRVLEPTWPAVDQDTQPMPTQDPSGEDESTIPTDDDLRALPGWEEPATSQAAVKPRRFSRQWWVENLSFSRVAAVGSSAVVLLVTGLGWIQ